MKIVVLVIASTGMAYDKFLSNWRAQNIPDNVRVYFLFCSEDQTTPFEIRGDSIYLKGRECVKPGIYHKTLRAMHHALSEPFDYLLRTNLSSYINFRKLNDFLKDKPRTNCVVGTYFSGGFLSGSAYIITRDLTEKFLLWCEEECDINPMAHFDDEFVGAFIKECSLPFIETNAITYDRSINLKDATNMIHVRFKSSSDQNERDADVEQHRAVIDMYNARGYLSYI